MVCKFCGKEFEGRKKKYCSDECRIAYGNAEYMKKYREQNPEKPYEERMCGHCGERFVTNKYQQIYCSRSCKRKSKYYRYDKELRIKNNYEIKSITYTCKQCGKEYHPRTSKDRDIFCSRECHQEFMHSNAKQKVFEPKLTYMKHCEICGEYFETKSNKRTKCSDCLYEENKNRSIERQKIQVREAYEKEVEEKECDHCGKKFVPELAPGWKTKRFCSDICAKRHHKNMRHYRIRTNGESDVHENYYVGRHQVGKRDNWICGICGEPIDRKLKFPNQMSFSVDHIIPLAKGGTHTMDNLQAAHLICNSYKSDQIV